MNLKYNSIGPSYYKLEGDKVSPCRDKSEIKLPHRFLSTTVFYGNYEVRVSTVFLSLDHDFTCSGEPVLFETMSFCEQIPSEVFQIERRYRSYDEAVEGHNEAILEAVKMVFQCWNLNEIL